MTDEENVNSDEYNFQAEYPDCKETRGVACSRKQTQREERIQVYAIRCDHHWKLTPQDSKNQRENSDFIVNNACRQALLKSTEVRSAEGVTPEVAGSSPFVSAISHSDKWLTRGSPVVILNDMKIRPAKKLKDGAQCKVIGGTHQGKSGTVTDIQTGKTGHVSITVVQSDGIRFKTLAKNVTII